MHTRCVLQEQWTIPATPWKASETRRAAIAWAVRNDVPEPPIEAVQLALSEALANAVVHAFDTDRPGTVTVTMLIDGDGEQVCVRVADDGRGMRPRIDSPGLGLGMPLMSALAQTLDIRSTPSAGSEIAMTFPLH